MLKSLWKGKFSGSYTSADARDRYCRSLVRRANSLVIQIEKGEMKLEDVLIKPLRRCRRHTRIIVAYWK